MSAAAIRTGAGATPSAPPPPVVQTSTVHSSLNAIFRSILEGVDSQDVASRGSTETTRPHAEGLDANGTSAMASFEASLAAFDYAGLGAGAGAAAAAAAAASTSSTIRSTAGTRGAGSTGEQRRASDSTTSPASTDLIAALAASAAAVVPFAAPTAASPSPSRSGLGASSPARVTADEMSAANWDVSGATPLKNLLASDTSLGFEKLQAKTHLAVAGSASAKAGATTVPGPSASAATSAALAPASAQGGAFGAAAGGGNSSSSGGSSKNPAGAPALAAQASSPVAVTSDPVADPASAAPAGVPLPQLADVIADQTQSLTTASAGVNVEAWQSVGNAKVKELEITLDPADLGKVSLKLRLSGGKLSVSIGVADPQTLSAIENERGAIESRLTGQQQSLDSLVIQQQEASASDAGTYGSAGRNGFDNSSSDGAERGSRSASSQGSSSSGALGSGAPGSGGGAGVDDLVV